jgi:Xaa-Pro dipeptidase
VDHGLRRARLAARLAELEVDAAFVTRLPNVRYLTGFSGSNGQVLVADGQTTFFTDGRYDEQSRHEVPDANRVIYLDGAAPVGASIAAIGARRIAFESEGVTHGSWRRLEDLLPDVELVPVGPEVERLRRIKEPAEIERIARAQEAADAAFEAVVLGGGPREGVTERELALELELAMRRAGADDRSFETIVAFGENAAEPHHDPTDRPLRRGDVMKLDFGALVDGYHSDMTRTLMIGEPSDTQSRMYDVVREAQAAGVAAVKAGAEARSVDEACRSVIREAGWDQAFLHATGHGVGLDIHEPPRVARTADAMLADGQVVTVEPGVYLAEHGGVRIEDTVVVTPEGCRTLTLAPKDPQL